MASLQAPATMDGEGQAAMSTSGKGESTLSPPHGRRQSFKRARLGDLNDQEVAVFCEVWLQLRQREVSLWDACAVGEDRESLVARFLRANQFNATKTIQMLEDDVHWRLENDISTLRTLKPKEILGCEVSELVKFYPHGHVGFDKCGRPIVVQRYGGFEVWNIKTITTLEAVVRYHIWEQERHCALLSKQCHRLGRPVDGFCMIIDVADMAMNKITREFLWLVQRIAEVDQKHYPERLGVMYIINTPSVFPLVWRGVKPWLDVRTTAKIQIFAKREQWQPAMLANIDPDQLPVEYAGTAPPLIGRESSLEALDMVMPLPGQPALDQSNMSLGTSARRLRAMESRRSERGILGASIAIAGSRVPESPGDDAASELYEDAVMLDIEIFEAEHGGKMGMQSIEEWTRLAADWRNGRVQFMNDPVSSIAKQQAVEEEYTTGMPSQTTRTRTGDQTWSEHMTDAMQRAPILCHVCRRILAWDVDRLQQSLEGALIMSLLFALLVIAFGVYTLATFYEISDLVESVISLSVLIVCLGSLILLLSFMGFIGMRFSNRLILNMYCFCMLPVSLVLLVIAATCFAAAAPENSAAFRILAKALVSVEGLQQSIKQNSLLLGAGALCGSSCNVVPCLLGLLLSIKLKQRPAQTSSNHEKHLRVVLRVSSYVTFSFGVVCIVYGAYATHRSMALYLARSVSTPFLLLQSGIILVLAASFGLWTSTCESAVIMSIYFGLLVPLFVLLTCFGAVSFADIRHVRADSNAGNDKGMVAWTQATLLVVGTLHTQTALFQLVCLLNSVALWRAVKDRWYRYRYRVFRPLKRSEQLIITWAISTGLFLIFFEGTFLVFNKWLSTNPACRKLWFLRLYAWIGEADTRYLNSDTFIVTSSGLLSILVGPACMFFAWIIYNRKPFRYLFGTIISSVLVYSQLLYYSTEMQIKFADIHEVRGSAFWIYVILLGFTRLISPVLLLRFMLQKSYRKLQRLKNLEIVEIISRLATERAAAMTMRGSTRGAASPVHYRALEEAGPPVPLSVEGTQQSYQGEKPTLFQMLAGRFGWDLTRSRDNSAQHDGGVILLDVDSPMIRTGSRTVDSSMDMGSRGGSPRGVVSVRGGGRGGLGDGEGGRGESRDEDDMEEGDLSSPTSEIDEQDDM